MKKALICGVSGQGGSYLAQLLLNQGYQVVGSSRDAQTSSRKSRETFGWQAKYTMKQVVALMVEDELRHLKVHGA
jgi:GDPmannose 4,6-dehydratase